MNNQIYTPKQDYKVLVSCMTYNHSKYIEDALNGFAMQQTSFPFVCLVMDDCSTDGEQEVIKAWMERECDMSKAEYVEIEKSKIILVPHKSNKQCTFAFYFLKENMYKVKAQKLEMVKPWREHCEYEAMCEGDDYWIADDKLQRQFDWMEEHQDYAYCWTNARPLVKGYLRNPYNRHKNDCDIPTDEIIIEGGAWVPTASIFIKIDVIMQLPKEKFYVGDYVMQIFGSYLGKVRYLNEVTCVYRIFSTGSWTEKYKTLSRETKEQLWEKEHYLLERMNFYTQNRFTTSINQRWYLFSTFNYLSLKDYKKAAYYYEQLSPIYKKRIALSDKYYLEGNIPMGLLCSAYETTVLNAKELIKQLLFYKKIE